MHILIRKKKNQKLLKIVISLENGNKRIGIIFSVSVGKRYRRTVRTLDKP